MTKKYWFAILFALCIPIILSCTSNLNKELPGVSVVSDINNIGRISSIVEDHEGYIWMSTLSAGLLKYNGNNYVRFSTSNNPGSISANVVNTVFVDSKGYVWAGTQKGINRYIRESNGFEHYQMDDDINYITNIFEDQEGRIFATTRRYLFLLDKSTRVFNKKISFENATNIKIIVGNEGDLWITNDTSIEHYNHNLTLVNSYKSPMPIISAVYDGANNIYVLSFPIMFRFDIDSLQYIDIPEALKAIDLTNIRYMNNLDNNMIIWITNNGHYCYNSTTEKLYTEKDTDFPYKIPRNISINSIYKDSENNIWFLTDEGYVKSAAVDRINNPDYILSEYLEDKEIGSSTSDGLYVWIVTDRNKLTTYNIITKEIKVSEISTLTNRSLGDNKFINLYYAQDGRLMLNIDNNVYEFSVNNGNLSFKHFYISNMLSPYLVMVVDNSGTLWTGGGNDNIQYSQNNNVDNYIIRFNNFNIKNETTQIQVSAVTKLKNGDIVFAYSDLGMVIINPRTMEYRKIQFPDKYKQMYISHLYEDNRGRIWIGTSDIGLFVYNPMIDKINQITKFEGLNIKKLIEDKNGQLIVLCESTLYKLNTLNNQFEPIWKINSELPPVMNILVLPNGNILAKTSNRCFSLSFNAISQKDILSKFEIIIAKGSRVIDIKEFNEMISGEAEVILPSKQNEINLLLSTLNYSNYKPVNYSYKIGRRNKEWTELLNNPELQFHYLSYGNNRIQFLTEPILKSNEYKIFNLNIKVLRPWYLSITSKTIYILFLISIFTAFYNLIRRFNNKRIEVEIATKEKDMQEKLNMENMDFFANISHEFRTPLTIISGAANILCRDTSFTPQQTRLPRIMQRNANRMLKLVSQLLDFNKLEHDKLQLNVELGDVANLINEITEVFTFGAGQKGIDISVVGCDSPILVWMDKDKIEKVMYNLLSNALKFSPPDSKIVINVHEVNAIYTYNFFGIEGQNPDTSGYLMVSVIDNGIGLQHDSLQYIFERFGQIRSTNRIGGTGIGLYFTKSMIELHHGFIKAQNRNSDVNSTKRGAVFTFAVPVEASAYSKTEFAKKENIGVSIDSTDHLSEYAAQQPSNEENLANTILIIDDDYEIVFYLKSILSQQYRTIICCDAMNGYNLIEREHPDIIISDILMLEMDGLQLCRMVKENISMCHIPFILLTAKSTVEDQITGLETGADAYVVKPFDPKYLFALIHSMLENRDNVRSFLENNTKIENNADFTISLRDKVLMENLYEIMEADLSNPELNIKLISEELCVSRTKLYYKLKSLTGKTPNEFFKTYKLNRSVELIKEGRYKISAIADMVGFSSPSHFAASFKKQFGFLPSKYSDQETLGNHQS